MHLMQREILYCSVMWEKISFLPNSAKIIKMGYDSINLLIKVNQSTKVYIRILHWKKTKSWAVEYSCFRYCAICKNSKPTKNRSVHFHD